VDLDASNRAIEKVDGKELSKLKKLERLNLSGNPITRFPSITPLHSLKKLVIKEAKLKSVPITTKNESLVDLDLEKNEITRVGDLANFPSLKRVTLSFNDFHDDFNNIHSSKPLQLESLDVSYNTFNGIVDVEKIADPSTLKELDMTFCWIDDFTFLKKYTALEKFDADVHIASSIPDLGELKNLVALNLGHGRIQKIENLDGVDQLKELKLPGNKIREMEGLDSLEELEWLDLKHNNIDEIKGIEHNNKLWYLNLNQNEVKKIPDLSSFTNLTNLNLSHNDLDDTLDVSHLPPRAYNIDLKENPKLSCNEKREEYNKLRKKDVIKCK